MEIALVIFIIAVIFIVFNYYIEHSIEDRNELRPIFEFS